MQYLVGIDEVGRGSLAGPVVVAAVALSSDLEIKNKEFKMKLRDSKKLSVKQREHWLEWIKNHNSSVKGHRQIYYAAASVYPKVIDRINISKAANLAAKRAFTKLCLIIGEQRMCNARVILDGGLFLSKVNSCQPYSIHTIVGGDEKYNCIKLASIVAKVKRDRLLRHHHKQYPQYGFNQHKGYGTKMHLEAIKKYGLCPLHRLTFIKNFARVLK